MREFLTLGSRGTDMTGWVFGRLTVIGPTRRVVAHKHTRVHWLCRCACGAETEVPGVRLRRGGQVSCGCYRREIVHTVNRTHGQTATGRASKDYRSWQDMRARCNRKTSANYHNYGGRGITIDPRWDTFEQFIADMGPKPTPDHTIDRIDVNKGYGPENCRWLLKSEQAKNLRKNIHVTYNGRTMIASDWAREVGLNPNTLVGRLHEGWSLERALTTPAHTKKPPAEAEGS